MRLDDEKLYSQVLKGDMAALSELMRRYHSPIYRFLYRQTGDSTLADDLTQEIFIRLLAYRGTAPTRFKTWVYTIASNLIRDHFKSARYRYEQATDFADDTHEVADAVGDASTERDEIIEALAKLTPDHREVLILRFYQDLKLEEIAEVTGAPLGTVKSRLFHALKGMKGFLTVREVAHDGS